MLKNLSTVGLLLTLSVSLALMSLTSPSHAQETDTKSSFVVGEVTVVRTMYCVERSEADIAIAIWREHGFDAATAYFRGSSSCNFVGAPVTVMEQVLVMANMPQQDESTLTFYLVKVETVNGRGETINAFMFSSMPVISQEENEHLKRQSSWQKA